MKALTVVVICALALSFGCILLNNTEIIEANATPVPHNATVAEAFAAGNAIKCAMEYSSANASLSGMPAYISRINGTVLVKKNTTRWSLSIADGGKTISENSLIGQEFVTTEVTRDKVDALKINESPYARAESKIMECRWLRLPKDMLPGDIGAMYSSINIIEGNMTIPQIEKAYSDKGISMQCSYRDISDATFIITSYCTIEDIMLRLVLG